MINGEYRMDRITGTPNRTMFYSYSTQNVNLVVGIVLHFSSDDLIC